MGWLTDPFAFGFMRTALLGGALVGVACASVGTYVVLRRMAFVGDALSHTVLPGVAVAVLAGWSLVGGALVAALITAVLIGLLAGGETLREDAAIGVVYTAMFALGLLVLSVTRGYRDLTHILFGNILGVTGPDLVGLAVIAALVVGVLAAFHKELELTSVDPLGARAMGLRADRTRMGLLVLLAPTVVAGIQAVGVVLVAGLLVTPAAAASLLTRRLVPMMALSVAIAVAATAIGLVLSFHLGGSSGAAIVLSASALFALAFAGHGLRRLRAGVVA